MENTLTKLTYTVQGMTCGSCEKTIESKISGLAGVVSVQANRIKNDVQIQAERPVSVGEIRQALLSLPKYLVKESAPAPVAARSFYQIYKPLFVLVSFIFLVSASVQVSLGEFDSHLFMNHLMAGFFIGFSFFKFLDLQAFAESFSSYDPIAQRWTRYGLIYPFLELFLGLLFATGMFLLGANVATILILSITTIGIYRRLQAKSAFQCACLGTTFNLPLSNVTIVENLVMIAMAMTSLIAY